MINHKWPLIGILIAVTSLFIFLTACEPPDEPIIYDFNGFWFLTFTKTSDSSTMNSVAHITEEGGIVSGFEAIGSAGANGSVSGTKVDNSIEIIIEDFWDSNNNVAISGIISNTTVSGTWSDAISSGTFVGNYYSETTNPFVGTWADGPNTVTFNTDWSFSNSAGASGEYSYDSGRGIMAWLCDTPSDIIYCVSYSFTDSTHIILEGTTYIKS